MAKLNVQESLLQFLVSNNSSEIFLIRWLSGFFNESKEQRSFLIEIEWIFAE